jgi:hypothetical protein
MVKLTELVEAEFGSIVDERAHRCFGPFAARILRLDMKVWFVEVALESGELCWESLVHQCEHSIPRNKEAAWVEHAALCACALHE